MCNEVSFSPLFSFDSALHWRGPEYIHLWQHFLNAFDNIYKKQKENWMPGNRISLKSILAYLCDSLLQLCTGKTHHYLASSTFLLPVKKGNSTIISQTN